MEVVVLITLLFLLLLGSLPIFMCLGLSTLLVLAFGTDIPPMIVAQRFFAGIDKFALMAMPLFHSRRQRDGRWGVIETNFELVKSFGGSCNRWPGHDDTVCLHVLRRFVWFQPRNGCGHW